MCDVMGFDIIHTVTASFETKNDSLSCLPQLNSLSGYDGTDLYKSHPSHSRANARHVLKVDTQVVEVSFAITTKYEDVGPGVGRGNGNAC